MIDRGTNRTRVHSSQQTTSQDPRLLDTKVALRLNFIEFFVWKDDIIETFSFIGIGNKKTITATLVTALVNSTVEIVRSADATDMTKTEACHEENKI